YPITAFVIEVEGLWMLVTAGHVFKELEEPLRQGTIRIETASLADYFGPNAKVMRPIAYDYEADRPFFVDDDAFGLDLGIIILRHYYREHLISNGIVPIARENWFRQHEVQFDRFGLLGFPKHLTSSRQGVGEFGPELVGQVEPLFVPIEKLDKAAV